jgi:hypothetical protein
MISVNCNPPVSPTGDTGASGRLDIYRKTGDNVIWAKVKDRTTVSFRSMDGFLPRRDLTTRPIHLGGRAIDDRVCWNRLVTHA